MEVVEVADAQTCDVESVTSVDRLVGKKVPFAYMLNYNGHGYAKFKVDHKSLIAFEKNLGVIYLLYCFIF